LDTVVASFDDASYLSSEEGFFSFRYLYLNNLTRYCMANEDHCPFMTGDKVTAMGRLLNLYGAFFTDS
jgi:hypothetical protein